MFLGRFFRNYIFNWFEPVKEFLGGGRVEGSWCGQGQWRYTGLPPVAIISSFSRVATSFDYIKFAFLPKGCLSNIRKGGGVPTASGFMGQKFSLLLVN